MLFLLFYGVCKNVAKNNRDSSWIWPTNKHIQLCTHTHIHSAANTQLRYVVCFLTSCTLHFSCYCLLKNFYFLYLNMLILSELSFRTTWYPQHPTSATSQFLCIFPSTFFYRETSESFQILATRFSVWLSRACCNICSSWGLYVFTGITQPAQTHPYEAHTHTHRHTYTEGKPH